MAAGGLDVVEEASGEGIPVWGYALGGIRVGSGPGASVRGSMWINLPRATGRVERLLLSIGVFTDKETRAPFPWKLIVDGVSVSREFKPHFAAEVDEGYYMKAVYDVKPVLAGRIAGKETHKVLVYRDSVHPITLADAFLYARYACDKAKYTVAYRTGAVSLKPGDHYKVDLGVGRDLGGNRSLGVIVHSPYHDSRFEVVAGGSKPGTAVGRGPHYIEVSVPYKGTPLPVAFKYVDPGFKFYPRIAVLTEVIASEIVAPAPDPRLVVESVEAQGGRVRVKGYVENRGDDALDSALLVVIAFGARLERRSLPPVVPGGRAEFAVEFDVSRLPVKPSKAALRLVWRRLGETRHIGEEIEIPY